MWIFEFYSGQVSVREKINKARNKLTPPNLRPQREAVSSTWKEKGSDLFKIGT